MTVKIPNVCDFEECDNPQKAGGKRMTLRELSQLYYLNREIEMDQRRLHELEALAQSEGRVIPEPPGSTSTTCEVEYYVSEISGLRGIIDAKHQQCLYERGRLERYIADIDDSLLRQIFTYRFINGLSWRQVAARIGGGNTADGCRMSVKRFLRKKGKNF